MSVRLLHLLEIRGEHYVQLELVLEPGDVELKIRSHHLLPGPASHFGDHPGSHVVDVAVGVVQEPEEVYPDRLSARRSVSLYKTRTKCRLGECRIVSIYLNLI